MKSTGYVVHMKDVRSIDVHKILVLELEGKRLSGRPRHKWKDNCMSDLKKIGCEGVDLINLARDTVLWLAVMSKLQRNLDPIQ
jgi:hypothetical protein